MPRYVKDLSTALTRDQASWVIVQYLQGQGFEHVNERGEMAWRKGVGWLASPQFIKAEAADGAVHIEAWLAGFAFFPGVYAGEQGLEGFYGWAVKSALKAKVAELERRLTEPADAVPQAPGGA